MSDDFSSYSTASAWGGDPLAGRQKDADAFFARIQEEGLAGNYLQLKGANKQDVAGMVYRGSPDEAIEAVRNHAPTGGQDGMPGLGGMGSEDRRYSPPDDPPSDSYRIPPAAGNTIYNSTGPDITVEMSVANYGVKGVEGATAEVEAAALRGTKSALQLAATRMSIGTY